MTVTSRRTPSRGSATPGGTPQTWQPGHPISALVGLVAMGVAIGAAELLSALGTWLGWLSTASSPITSLGTTFIHLTPEWLKEFAVRTFGQHDKDALRVGMYITLLLVSLIIGLVARRSPRIAAGVTVVLILVTIAAIYTTTGAIAFDALPILIGGAGGIYLLINVFRRMVEPVAATRVGQVGKAAKPIQERVDGSDAADRISAADRVKADDRADGDDRADSDEVVDRADLGRRVPAGTTVARGAIDRRQFFRLTAIGAAVAVAAGAISRWIPSTAEVMASRAKAVVPVPSSPQTIPADADFKISGLTSYVTPISSFYRVDTAFVPPNITAEEWTLKIHGMVDNEVSIGYNDLIARPQIERNITLTCVSNPVGGDLAGNATWIGARIDDLIKQARPSSGADCVLCTSKDGFTVTTPLAALTDGRDALLAVSMNGEVLPIDHGFPVRMVVPGLYGYVSATKWVVDMKVSTFSQESAYWTQRGWSDHGPIKTASRIDLPRASSVPAGAVTVAGMAWAQHRGIKAVEVQVDNGPWEPAELAGDASADTWRQWRYTWNATAGEHVIRSRATDGTGAVQTSAVQDVIPDGATGYDSRTVDVS